MKKTPSFWKICEIYTQTKFLISVQSKALPQQINDGSLTVSGIWIRIDGDTANEQAAVKVSRCVTELTDSYQK